MRLQIGSLLCAVDADPPHYAELLADLYGTDLFDSGRTADRAPVRLVVRITEQPTRTPGNSDALRVERIERGYRFETDPLDCRLFLDRGCPCALMRVKQPEMDRELLGFHFWLLTNRLLLSLDRLLLHAAAVDFEGRINLFSGHKGSGKSTLSIALGQQGGTILAEDHVVLHRQEHEFLVSGCSSRIKLTAETEHVLIQNQLDADVVDVGGMPKKVFQADDLFSAQPYEDRKPDRLFLTRVGGAFSCRPAPPRDALSRLMDTTSVMLRLSGKQDLDCFLHLLSGFVQSVDTYDLVLSPDISKVRRVVPLLRAIAEKQL